MQVVCEGSRVVCVRGCARSLSWEKSEAGIRAEAFTQRDRVDCRSSILVTRPEAVDVVQDGLDIEKAE